jgi:hypothetical protein
MVAPSGQIGRLYLPGSQFTHGKFTHEKLVPSERDVIWHKPA